MRIAVAGGTGLVGTHVVDVARSAGHEVVVLSAPPGVDLVTGAGLAGALEGVDAVIDVVNVNTLEADESVAFFEAATRNLLAAEAAASASVTTSRSRSSGSIARPRATTPASSPRSG